MSGPQNDLWEVDLDWSLPSKQFPRPYRRELRFLTYPTPSPALTATRLHRGIPSLEQRTVFEEDWPKS